MTKILVKSLLLVWMVSLLISCAGPMGAFGGNNILLSKDKLEGQYVLLTKLRGNARSEWSVPGVKIEMAPSFIWVHKHKKFKVTITDTEGIGLLSEIKFIYNDEDITKKFKNLSDVINLSENKRVYQINNMRFLSKDEGRFIVSYRRNVYSPLNFKRYEHPHCHFNHIANRKIEYLPAKGEELKTTIERLSRRYKLNPLLVAGLIAQESNFKQDAISSARALGLTQITFKTAEYINSFRFIGPLDPDTKSSTIPHIKALLMLGNINAESDWRLNQSKSILGGIRYLKYLERYWMKTSNFALLSKLSLNPDKLFTDVILASYNSGPSRVKRQINKYGDKWYLSKNLSEGKKYFKRVKSYCYQFSGDI